MSTELSTVEPTEPTQIEAVEQGQTDQEVAQPETETKDPPAEDPVERATRKLTRAIDRKTAALGAERLRNQQLQEELRHLRERAQPDTDKPFNVEDLTPEKLDEMVTSKAKQLADSMSSGKTHNDQVNSFVLSGEKLDKGFKDVCKEIGEELPFYENGKATPFLEATLEADIKPAVWMHLHQNPDLLDDFRGLSATRIAVKLADIQREIGSRPAVSKVPAPISPVAGGNGSTNKSPEEESFADYEKRRKKEGARWA